MAYGQAPFMRFYESKEGQDPRFVITSPASGCMLYFDSTLNKFVNSNSLLFDPVTFTFTVHQVDTDILTATTQLITDGDLIINDQTIITNNYALNSFSSTLNFYFNGVSIATIGTTGITTLVPQKIQNTQQTTGTQFLTMMPLSATTAAGQIIGTHPTLTYDVTTATLATTNMTATTFTGSLTGSATLVDNTLQTTGTQFLTMMPLSATTAAGQVVGTHATLSYNVATATLATTNMTATTFTGSLTGSASRVGNTLQTTGTQFLTFLPLSATTASQVVGTHATLSYNVATATLATTNMTATTFTGALTGSASRVGNTLQTTGTQFLTFLPLSATTASQVVGTHGVLSYNVGTETLATTNIDVNDNLGIYDPNNPTQYFEIDHLNGDLTFNNAWSPIAVPFIINGDGEGVQLSKARPFATTPTTEIELDSPQIIDGNNTNAVLCVGTTTNDYSSLTSITDPTSVASGALISFSVQAVNVNNKLLVVSLPVNMSGTVTGTVSGTNRIYVNMTAITITATRNGGSYTDFAYQKPTLPLQFDYSFTGTSSRLVNQPYFQLEITLNPTNRLVNNGTPFVDAYVFKMVTTMTTTVISGGGTWAGAYGGAGFTLNLNTAHGTGAGVTYNTADPTVTALSVTKNQSISRPTARIVYFNSQYINFVYERSITSSSTGFEPACFSSDDFDDFEINLYVSTAPSSDATFIFGFATDTGTSITTNYAGRTAELGSTYATFSWTVGAFITRIKPVANQVYTWRVSNPNASRRKTITGTNLGYASAVDTNVPYVCAGEYTSAVAYNSARWSSTAINITGTIYVYGKRTD